MELSETTLAALRAERRRHGVSFLIVDDSLVGKIQPMARVVDLAYFRENEESPVVECSIRQHYGALCGALATVEGHDAHCVLTPGHSGNHHFYGVRRAAVGDSEQECIVSSG